MVTTWMQTQRIPVRMRQNKVAPNRRTSQKKIKDLVPKRGSTSVAWTWFGYEKSDMD